MKLWEANHPYYCCDHNYRVAPADGGNRFTYESWADFLAEHGDDDHDYNLVFRWDWTRPDPDDYEGGEDGDFYPGDSLDLYVMQQRHGDFVIWSIDITEDDEPAVRAWLADRARTIAAIWAPITLAPAEVTA